MSNSCGQRRVDTWQREIAAELPEIPYAGVVFTTPDTLLADLQE
jgi:hypothetical protein